MRVRILRSKKLMIVLAATVLVAAATAAVAISSAGGIQRTRGVVSRTILADGENIHYQFLKIVADDYDSGWLVHPGIVFIQVQEGSLQITQGGCTPKTVGPGETFIKVPYSPVRGTSKGRVVFTASFFVRYEDPLLIPVASPCP